MIYFFSGTGNSAFIARTLANRVGDSLQSFNRLLKEDDGNREIELHSSAEQPFIFVAPTYAWRLPRVVEDLLRRANFSGKKEAYFILSCGDGSGNAAAHIRKLCQEKGLILRGFAEIVMPENYVAMFSCPTEEKAKVILEKAAGEAERLAELIHSGKDFPEFRPKLAFLSLLTPVFYRFIVKAKGFHSTDACIACDRCVQLCPLNNIHLSEPERRPVWGNRCTHCMACIGGCPKEAIEYKNKTKGKRRYFLREA